MTSKGQFNALTRRHFLIAGAAAATLAGPGRALARTVGGERALSLFNIHTGESVRRVYWQAGRYDHRALADINHLLRDWRSEEVYDMDTGVLDLLARLHGMMETSEPFHIISGYRSPHTNAQLRADGRGVARKSLHMQGKAIDVSLPGRDLRDLHKAAKSLKLGGVGYYGKSGFIHVDTGRVRYW